MFAAKPSAQKSARPPKEKLPTMYDLPDEFPEDPGLPDEFHDLQPDFLRLTLHSRKFPSEQIFIGTNLNIHYDLNHPLWHKRPDWFVAVGVPRLYDGHDLRKSYLMWQEEVSPLVIVELLSPGTTKEDLGENAPPEEEEIPDDGQHGVKPSFTPPSKWEVYEQILKVPHYIVFNRFTNRLRYFKLEQGSYQEQSLNEMAPLIWIPELELGIGLWEGEGAGIHRLWLRWCDEEGNWIPTPAEAAEQRAEAAQQQAEAAQQQAEAAQQRAETAEQRAETAERAIAQAIPRLLNLGLAPPQIAETLGISVEEVNRRMQQ
ncbi:MAG: Uma2 family endonuclease [Cyanobacteriota bacterium]|nr:Uma2 family endonuclease [Cyanobacteriota bacterium]